MKEKRKTRLDKATGGATEFIGFQAFASNPLVSATSSSRPSKPLSDNTRTTTLSSSFQSSSIQWSPMYTGSEPSLQTVFQRISQKRDGVTKAKALLELGHLLGTEELPRFVQKQALSHYLWLYCHKVVYDPNSAVRAQGLEVWTLICQRTPKAVVALTTPTRSATTLEDVSLPHQVWGMWYTAQCDPAAEVRHAAEQTLRAAVAIWDTHHSTSSGGKGKDDAPRSPPWLVPTVAYTTRLLGYGRPSTMHEALFASKKTGSAQASGGKNNKNVDSNNTSERQKEDMEERFKIQIVMALDSLAQLMQPQQGGTISSSSQNKSMLGESMVLVDQFSETKVVLWCKAALTSPMDVLRRKTYQLVALMATHQRRLIDPLLAQGTNCNNDKTKASSWYLPSALVQSLSSEKNPQAWPTLLEAWLAVLVCLLPSEREKQQSEENQPTIMYESWKKPLLKALRKACYGASVEAWGPILLPLTTTAMALQTEATVADNKTSDAAVTVAVALVQAAWEGRSVTLGMTETGRLAHAVAETAHYCLLRKQPHLASMASRESVQPLMETWLEVLDTTLTDTSLSTGQARTAAWEPLIEDMARQLHRFGKQSIARSEIESGEESCLSTRPPENFFAILAPAFWGKLSGFPISHPMALVRMLQHLLDLQKAEAIEEVASQLPPAFTKVLLATFEDCLEPLRESSGEVPTAEIYQVLRALMELAPTAMATEKFIMNDLLRWMILHTTDLPPSGVQRDVEQSETLVRADFELLVTAFGANVKCAVAWWPTLVRELLAARCNLYWLATGFRVLFTSPRSVEWMRCQEIDDFGKIAILDQQSMYPGSDKVQFGHCLMGVSTGSNATTISTWAQPIISENTWVYWVNQYRRIAAMRDPTQHGRGTAATLSQILLQIALVPSTKKLLKSTDVEEIILQSWRHEPPGQNESNPLYLQVLKSHQSMVPSILLKAREFLRRDLQALTSDPNDDKRFQNWAYRAERAIQMGVLDEPSQTTSLLDLGLADEKMWVLYPTVMFPVAVALFNRLDATRRQALLTLPSQEQSVQLFLTMLISVSEARSGWVEGSKARYGDDRSIALFNSIGIVDKTFIDSANSVLISTMIPLSLEEGNDLLSRRQVCVLSHLLKTRYPPEIHNDSDDIPVAEAIKQGDNLFYITERSDQQIREPVSVAKVHYDSQAGYYFTISLSRGDVASERQTVLERLRTRNGAAVVQSENVDDDQRRFLRNAVVSDIFVPLYASAKLKPASKLVIGELFDLSVATIGVGEERGIGSTHFDLFKILSAKGRDLQSVLKKNQFEFAEDLWCIALSFGFGRNLAGSRVFSFDPCPLHRALLDFFSANGIGDHKEIELASIAWLVVSLPMVESPNDMTGLLSDLMLRLAKAAFKRSELAGFTDDAFIAIRALSFTTMNSNGNQGSYCDNLRVLEADCLKIALNSFSLSWPESKERYDNPIWKQYSDFTKIVATYFQRSSSRHLIADNVDLSTVEGLVKGLFSSDKRFVAFAVLDRSFCRDDPSREEDDIELGDSTKEQIEAWVAGMEEEEALEIKEDVEIVNQWMPKSLMEEMETWKDELYEDLQETKIVGRFLAWLGALRLVESAAPKDARNRPAFVSYLTRSEAVSSILNLAILFHETVNSRKPITTTHPTQFDQLSREESMFQPSVLSSLVLFRTFEVLPSICRRWWEEECPKIYTDRVQSVVEKQIAPIILERELGRIRESTEVFGDMNVTASTISREINARYIQDDFALTVLVRLPAAFPLRSAEVDCSKTLGVPQNRWKRWSLQITMMLNNQGGTLQDALILWKENVDKEFDGVEPCPVCYSVLHVKSRKLPALECTTCHNRFHAECLTQWFKTSGKSQCVLCQQDWRGTRVM